MNLQDLRSKDKLNGYIKRSLNDFFRIVLDYAEVAVGDKERHKVLRQRILKLGNEKLRDIEKEVEERYDVVYNPPGEDVIKFNVKK